MQTGAYGLRLSGALTRRPELLNVAPSSWVSWHLEARLTDLEAMSPSDDFAGPDHARLTTEPAGYVDIDRRATTSTLVWDHEPSLDELLHPGLATTAATVAWWQGRSTLHGAGLCRDGQALGILGQRERGKSSTAAWLMQHGWGVVSDDLLVLDGTEILAGPRIVDLREQSAKTWDLGEYIGKVGTRDRWRFTAPSVPAQVPLAALVELEWGEELQIHRIPVAERVEALFAHRTLDLPLLNPASLLTLMGVPLFRLVRPHDLKSIERSMALIFQAIGM